MNCNNCNKPIRQATAEEIVYAKLDGREHWIHETGFWSCFNGPGLAEPVGYFSDGSPLPDESLYSEAQS